MPESSGIRDSWTTVIFENSCGLILLSSLTFGLSVPYENKGVKQLKVCFLNRGVTDRQTDRPTDRPTSFFFFNAFLSWVVVHTFNPSTGSKGKQIFVSSRTAWATQRKEKPVPPPPQKMPFHLFSWPPQGGLTPKLLPPRFSCGLHNIPTF